MPAETPVAAFRDYYVVKDLTAEGKNARIGVFKSWGLDYDDEAYNYVVRSYMEGKEKEAEEKGIQKRVLVNENDGSTFEYFDLRDFPDFHEETEEEQKARLEKENRERDMNGIACNMHKDRMQDEICDLCSKNTAALATLLFLNDDYTDLSELDDSVKQEIGFVEDENSDYPDTFDFLIEKKFTPDKILKLLKENAEILFGNIYYNTETMKNVYRIICSKDGDKLKPSKKDIEKEYNRVQEEKKQKETT